MNIAMLSVNVATSLFPAVIASTAHATRPAPDSSLARFTLVPSQPSGIIEKAREIPNARRRRDRSLRAPVTPSLRRTARSWGVRRSPLFAVLAGAIPSERSERSPPTGWSPRPRRFDLSDCTTPHVQGDFRRFRVSMLEVVTQTTQTQPNARVARTIYTHVNKTQKAPVRRAGLSTETAHTSALS